VHASIKVGLRGNDHSSVLESGGREIVEERSTVAWVKNLVAESAVSREDTVLLSQRKWKTRCRKRRVSFCL